jgi:hypothetical protein
MYTSFLAAPPTRPWMCDDQRKARHEVCVFIQGQRMTASQDEGITSFRHGHGLARLFDQLQHLLLGEGGGGDLDSLGLEGDVKRLHLRLSPGEDALNCPRAARAAHGHVERVLRGGGASALAWV